ncbi:MAG: 4-hydroxy-tetrahydrodipicolinate synthase [Flavobacteriales bacterium]|nr:4-hydroxy-tetrahydrodipicolinate synthase [Flavobacteriales bacterium]
MQHKFSGLGVAMVTPFNSDDTVDFAGLARLTEYLIAGGVDYLVVQGTTGESATLTKDEKIDVLEHVKDVNNSRLPIVFGHGGNNTAELVNGFKKYDFEGVDAILSASPYYNKPTQEGIYLHYKALSEASPVPIILYNVPGRTASNVSAATTLRLANDFKNIIAIKEASGNLGQISQILKQRPKGFAVISGDDPLVVPHIAIGGDGVISVIGNATPKVFSKMVKDALKGDFAAAAKTHLLVLDLIDLLFVEGNPGGIKAALEIKKVCGAALRLPLAGVSKATYDAIAKEIKDLD